LNGHEWRRPRGGHVGPAHRDALRCRAAHVPGRYQAFAEIKMLIAMLPPSFEVGG